MQLSEVSHPPLEFLQLSPKLSNQIPDVLLRASVVEAWAVFKPSSEGGEDVGKVREIFGDEVFL